MAFDKVTKGWGVIVWRKQDLGNGIHRYIVSVGDRKIGEVWPVDAIGHTWTAISYAQGSELLGLRGVDGFATRWYATQYLLNVGVWPTQDPWKREESSDDA